MISSTTAENRIPASWLPLMRAVWFGFALLLLGFYFVGLGPRYAELSAVCPGGDCGPLIITAVEQPIIGSLGFSLQSYAFFEMAMEGFLVLIFAGLGFLVFRLRSDTWIGWLVSLAFLFIGLVFFAEESRTLERLYPGLFVYVEMLSAVSVGLLILLFYLFPDGRFAPRWLGRIGLVMLAVLVLDPLVIRTEARGASASLLIIIVFVLGVSLGIYSQVYRFRRVSNATQRQQTKWVLLGFVGMFSGMLPWAIFAEIAPLEPGPARVLFNFSLLPQYVLIGLFPLSVVISIMRYRLWDIDLIIRRTLSYAALTGILAITYFGSVVVIQSIFLGGADSPLVTVVSTLAIAALFNPLRLRIQDFIDRRFYRQKYNAEQTLSHFASAARDEVDLESLGVAILGVVDETMQPETVSLWLKR